jgi:hypothetical protein
MLYPLILCLGVLSAEPDPAPNERLEQATRELAAAKTPMDRFYALNDCAKESFAVGKLDDARYYAGELPAILPHFQNNWNYGNAVQDAHLVLGRIAVREKRISDAKRHLYASGKSGGSPQLNTFGPNMSLAKDLLEKGERQAVLDHFERCRTFWKMDQGELDKWSRDVQDGKTPDFGLNLVD